VLLFVLAVLVPLAVAASVIALAILVLRRRSRLRPAVGAA